MLHQESELTSGGATRRGQRQIVMAGGEGREGKGKLRVNGF